MLTCTIVASLQVLHGRHLGINCIVILEQYAELATLLEAAARLGVQPAIGVRARLSTHHAGCARPPLHFEDRHRDRDLLSERRRAGWRSVYVAQTIQWR